MKRLILLAVLAVTTQIMAAESAPKQQPTMIAAPKQQPTTTITPEQQPTMIAVPKQVKGPTEINLRIEPLSDDQVKNGLSMDTLTAMVIKRLSESEIPVSDTVTQPILVLRVKSIPSGVDVATYFQLSLLEESMLLRNRSTFNSITWSQASLLSCRPDELQKEVMETVDSMIQAFSKDYQKAFAQQSTAK